MFSREYKLLDLGCARGKLVADVIESGNAACGIEVSNYCLLRERFEWGNLKSAPYLFTADITKKFALKTDGNTVLFDIVTLWEVVEHITKDDFSVVLDNIKKHLKSNGIVVMSVNQTKHKWHNKIWNLRELIEFVSEKGFRKIDIFNDDEYVRKLRSSFYLDFLGPKI